MDGSWRPSAVQRLRGWALVAPSRLYYLYDSNETRATDEDAFSAGEGGGWAWYPVSGTFAPFHLSRWWRVSGRGAPAFGSVSRTKDRARFVPNAFWSTRGLSDWERDVLDEDIDGAWHRLTFVDGTTVVRER